MAEAARQKATARKVVSAEKASPDQVLAPPTVSSSGAPAPPASSAKASNPGNNENKNAPRNDNNTAATTQVEKSLHKLRAEAGEKALQFIDTN